jgi:hypothetical protein
MTNTHEVISAFLDDRPFALDALAAALDDPDGRGFLVDAIGLRRLVQPVAVPPPASARPAVARGRMVRVASAAAIVMLALAGGYVIGARRLVARVEAPPAARVIQLDVQWQDVADGGQQ